ncbi:MAG: thiamine pyrophosphate-binding protein [Vicinamibacterales bacterium]
MSDQPSCAAVLARTLREAGITRMFGLPGGEILEFIHAAKREGIEFLLTRHEAAASFMADVTGQIQRKPGVCVSTLGPGAVNMTLGVANAFLDRSPLVAVTATMSASASPYATHQNLDLNAVYRPFTKMAITLDGHDTAAKARRALCESMAPRMGPVHIAIPSDVARLPEKEPSASHDSGPMEAPRPPRAGHDQIARLARELSEAERPLLIFGLDLDPYAHVNAARAFAERLGVPVFATPKGKGLFPEDHPLFCGVCAGVAGDSVIVDFFKRADLLIGLGFEPVESDKLWHRDMKLASIGPVSIAAGAFQPHAEVVGDVAHTLNELTAVPHPTYAWTAADVDSVRAELVDVLRPSANLTALSGFELTRRLRELMPRDTIFTTDVGAIKSITSQAWASYEPLTFFESNGLSAMSYGVPAAMAARLECPDRPVLCTMGDGGFGMTCAEIETCVREKIHFMTVVYNDSSLSLIHVSQQNRGHAPYGVDHGSVDFAAVAAGLGAWSRRVRTMAELDAAVREGMTIDRPVVIDALVDPAEYRAHNSPRGVR